MTKAARTPNGMNRNGIALFALTILVFDFFVLLHIPLFSQTKKLRQSLIMNTQQGLDLQIAQDN